MSLIEWTDVTDNIIVADGGGWWCRKISPGCANCYAAKLNTNSFYGGNHLPYSGQPPALKLRQDVIDGWARQRKEKRHFVASMTDVFGDWVFREWIFAFLDGMSAAPRQIFQVLTKRPEIAAREIGEWLNARGLKELPPNIWIGTSVEDQERADQRIPHLLRIPAAVRFLSCEPLLGPVDLTAVKQTVDPGFFGDCLQWYHRGYCHELEGIAYPKIHWVICGGESGSKARPMNRTWARSLRDQCTDAGVPFFFKQWGEWAPGANFPDVIPASEYMQL